MGFDRIRLALLVRAKLSVGVISCSPLWWYVRCSRMQTGWLNVTVRVIYPSNALNRRTVQRVLKNNPCRLCILENSIWS